MPWEVIFDESTVVTITQSEFMRRNENKERPVRILIGQFIAKDHTAIQANDDADTLICTTAINIACRKKEESVIVVGEEINLLCILEANTPPSCSDIIFMKSGKGTRQANLYSIRNIQIVI